MGQVTSTVKAAVPGISSWGSSHGAEKGASGAKAMAEHGEAEIMYLIHGEGSIH